MNGDCEHGYAREGNCIECLRAKVKRLEGMVVDAVIAQTDAEAKADRLQVIVDRLPKCWGLNEAGELVQDVPVVPGMELISTYYNEIQEPRLVIVVRQNRWRFETSCWYYEASVHRPCYSTPEAAQAAKEKT